MCIRDSAMTKDIDVADYASGRPAFCYHLGDVVYYFCLLYTSRCV